MQTRTESEKPAYLGLLNAISLAESAAGVQLSAWAEATSDEALAGTLRLVAARETSHGDVFRRRLNELGFELRLRADTAAERRLTRLADPSVADADKIGAEREESDPFVEIKRQLDEDRFDPMTANLLTWYVAEEYDSGRQLREAYGRVRAKAETPASGRRINGAAPTTPSADAEAIMACMTAGFARLEKTLEKALQKPRRPHK